MTEVHEICKYYLHVVRSSLHKLPTTLQCPHTPGLDSNFHPVVWTCTLCFEHGTIGKEEADTGTAPTGKAYDIGIYTHIYSIPAIYSTCYVLRQIRISVCGEQQAKVMAVWNGEFEYTCLFQTGVAWTESASGWRLDVPGAYKAGLT